MIEQDTGNPGYGPRTLRIMSVVSIAMLFCTVARADAPWEKYHVTHGKELRTALQGTIGVLSISNGPGKQGARMRTRSVPARLPHYTELDVLAATIPVSNFSFHPPMELERIGFYRYPVVERCSSYVRIVYDPVHNWRAWVNLRDLEQDFVTEVVMLDSLAAAENRHYFLDVFRFTPDQKCRMYKAPSLDSGFTVISEEDTTGYLLKVLEVRDGFARVGDDVTDHASQLAEPRIVPLGWVRIWDDDGVLLVWIKAVDLC